MGKVGERQNGIMPFKEFAHQYSHSSSAENLKNAVSNYKSSPLKMLEYHPSNAHRLASQLSNHVIVDPLSAHMTVEKPVLKKYTLSSDLKGIQAFHAIWEAQFTLPGLIELGEIAAGASRSIRTNRIGTSPDSRGNFIEFLNPKKVISRLNEYCALLNDEARQQTQLFSIWSLVYLLNTHPFQDGNGRFARMMTAAILSKDLVVSASRMVPAHWIRILDSASFLLAIRRAELQNDWHPLIERFTGYLRLITQDGLLDGVNG